MCRADDDADRQALVRQQNKVAALEAQLAALKVCMNTETVRVQERFSTRKQHHVPFPQPHSETKPTDRVASALCMGAPSGVLCHF